MSRVAVFVGLDYHKDSVQVCAMDRDGKVLIQPVLAPTTSTPSQCRWPPAWTPVRAAIDVPLERGETRASGPAGPRACFARSPYRGPGPTLGGADPSRFAYYQPALVAGDVVA